jgi:hypothetical protein
MSVFKLDNRDIRRERLSVRIGAGLVCLLSGEGIA